MKAFYVGDFIYDAPYQWLRGYILGATMPADTADNTSLTAPIELYQWFGDGAYHGWMTTQESVPSKIFERLLDRHHPAEFNFIRGYIIGSVALDERFFEIPYGCAGCMAAMQQGYNEGIADLTEEYHQATNKGRKLN